MDYRKIIVIAALVAVALYLYNAWQREFPPQSTPVTQTSQQSTNFNNNGIPNYPKATNSSHVSSVPRASHKIATHQLINVKTDVLDIQINPQGGNLVKADLLQYPQSLDNKTQKVELFNNDPNNLYIAQSGLTGKQGPDTQEGLAHYSATKLNYTLQPSQKDLSVNLIWEKNGLQIVKTYTFHRGSYEVDMHYTVNNKSASPWSGFVYTQLARTEPKKAGSVLTHYATFTGAAISSPAEHYQKLKFKNFADEPINQNITGGWAAMVQHYFLSAWVPPQNQNYHYYTQVNNNGVYTVGMIGPEITVHPSQSLTTTNKLYVGPAIASNLNAVAPHLNMTIDYGWLWFISKLIFWLMKLIHGVVHNWGWSIIFTTIVIKVLFYPLSDKSFKSMANMRKLQPRMVQLKERFEGDRAGLSKATMELYRKEKVNPISGCLPIVIQIPVFIALYWVIIQSVELRQAPWMLWIKDLSVHDPYYILPIVMGGLMFLQQRMSPPPPDPTQAKVMMFMPVIFTVFFLHFPAGLVLYWITNTLFTICHQFYVYRRVDAAAKKTKQLKAKKK